MFRMKLRFFENFDQTLNFDQFWPIFRKFCPKLIFSKILTKIEVFENLHQNETFKDFDQNRYISKIVTQIRIFRKFGIIWDV